MAKMIIKDDCLVPDRYIRMKYQGPDPWGVAEKITDSVRTFFHVSTSGFNNYRINWDITGDPVTFYTRWWVRKYFSRFSHMMLLIKLRGSRSKTGNVGEFSLIFHASVITTFSGWGVFLKPAWLMYSYLFYNRARRTFIDRCRNYIMNFRNDIKEHFNLEATDVTTAAGSYG